MGEKRLYNSKYPPVMGGMLSVIYCVMERHLDDEKVKKCYDMFKAIEEVHPNGEKMVFIDADNDDLQYIYTYVITFFGEEIIEEIEQYNEKINPQ